MHIASSDEAGTEAARAAERAWEAEIEEQLVRDLYERSRLAVVTMLVLTAVIRWTIEPAYHAGAALPAVFWSLVGVNLARLLLALVPRERLERALPARRRLWLFAAAVGLSSVLLGLLVVLSWPLLDPTRIAILAVITSGIVSGAVMSLGFSPLVYMLYMLPPVGAMFVMAVRDTRPEWGAHILATAFVIYAAAVFAISLDQRRTRRTAIRLSLQLSDMVVRDTLTRLHNRRFLKDLMEVETARFARDVTDLQHGRQPKRDVAIGLYLMDLDFFKQVNDTHGHAAGDAILKQTAEVLTRAMRRSDNLVRWGGEEFVAVAWVKDPADVPLVAEKLRAAIERAEFVLPDGGVLRRTVSIGHGTIPFSGEQPLLVNWEQVLTLADAALYLAKREGRNRAVGVVAGRAEWPDTERTLAEAAADLEAAERRGLVRIVRGAAGGTR